MKKNIHPKYQQILFVDSATGHRFVCGSTLASEQKEVFNGKEYPVILVSTSSASHPFFTGSKQLVDAEGRVDKFKKRYMKKEVVAVAEEQGDSNESSEQKKPAKKAAARK